MGDGNTAAPREGISPKGALEKLPVHKWVQKRSAKISAQFVGKLEGIQHATVKCSMFKAV